MKSKVVLYRDKLLHFSENFVLTQGEAVRNYDAFYAGSRRVDQVKMPVERTIVVNGGNVLGECEEVLYKVLGIAPRFLDKLRRINPVLVHAHFGVDGALVLPITNVLKIPLVVTIHGYDVNMKDMYLSKVGYCSRLYLKRRDTLKQHAGMFIAVSNFIREQLIVNGFPDERIRLNYIGINLNRFKPDPLILREKIVLFVGRLSAEKGCEYLIRAMSRVQTVIPEVKTVIIGSGVQRAKLERLAKEVLLHSTFLGILAPSEVRAWMNKAKVLCVPSIRADSGECEAFGIVFAEAQAMGLPVVSFAVGGIPEAVKNGETGFLANEKDTDTLAGYIVELLSNEVLWQRFSLRGREFVADKFDLEKQATALERIYDEVIERKLRVDKVVRS